MSLCGMVSVLLSRRLLSSCLSQFSIEHFLDPPVFVLPHILLGHIQTRCIENEKNSEVSLGAFLEGNIYLFREYFSKYSP